MELNFFSQAIFKKMVESQALSNSLKNNFSKFSDSEFSFENAFSYNPVLNPNILRSGGIQNETLKRKSSLGSSSQSLNIFNLNIFNSGINYNNNYNSNNNNYNSNSNNINNNYNSAFLNDENNNFDFNNFYTTTSQKNDFEFCFGGNGKQGRSSSSDLEAHYEQMLFESIKKNKNLNDFYSSEAKVSNMENNGKSNKESLPFHEFFIRNNLEEYIFRKQNS